MESARKLGACWQILTLPCNDTASVANSLICHQRHVELAGGFSASFFLSFFFCSCKTDQDHVVALLRAYQLAKLAPASGKLACQVDCEHLQFFLLGHGLPGREPLRSRVTFTLPVLLCAFRAMIFSMFS